ncbi:uncharacterized protein ACHE_21269A [Aspergillus chevalieri]|uniref:Kelch repeat protein n=1 Tax=Aspergillus chevalieri TaxID=182096 RepID=A0A7R7VJF9_ASPCH|nr:uncharacterized protein ACHE_21269A [Aspergillus chevalieri]BCR85811.1 hypothetical protein ACHE_21269A [Aspergillus chevalieri]
MLIGILLYLSLWTALGLAQKYCTREFNSAVINNQTLYIDGGEVRNIYSNQSIIAEAARDLLAIDLSKPFTNYDKDLFTTIKKPFNASKPAQYPPVMNEGATFSDGSNLYFYGGYISGHLEPNIVPPLATWRYDIENDEWTSDGFKGYPVKRLSEGVTAQSNVNRKAYYLGGLLDPGGDPDVYGTDGAGPYPDSGMVVLDQETLTWSNLSTQSMNHFGTIADGYMNLIENFGDEGILLAFGGSTRPVAQPMDLLAASVMNLNYRNSMENISVYDIANDEWYTQQSTGDIPRWRMSGCSVVAPAQDLSSFSIYVFGGSSNDTESSDGNVYVLSIPSFQWIQLEGSNALRIKHKCQLAGQHTMLVVGGTVPVDGNEYEPLQANCDSDIFENGIGIFDLNKHQWKTNYDADDDKYTIHSSISDVIGGGKTGGATATEPKKGWNSTDLANVFKNKHVVSSGDQTSNGTTSSTPSASPSNTDSNSISKGGIAGATIGAVAGAAAIGGLAFFLVAYKGRRNAKEDSATDEPLKKKPSWAELHGQDRPFELAATGTGAAVAEMPDDPTREEQQQQQRQELPADTNWLPEMDGSQTRN